MKKVCAYLLPLTLLCGALTTQAARFIPRSHSVNTARQLAGMANKINLPNMEKVYGSLSVAVGGGKSFRDNSIARCLFGNDIFTCGDCPALRISGSRVANRSAHDFLADYFGLPTDYESIVLLKPEISYFIAAPSFYIGLDEWAQGLFFRVHAPIVRSTWDLNMCETNISGSASHEPGYFTESAVPRSKLVDSFTDFISNGKTPDLGDDVTFNPLCNCRLRSCDKTETNLADLRAIFGWNFLRDEDYHLGIGLLMAAPTGTVPDTDFIFDPIIGNGHHWEFGVHLTGHYTFQRSTDEEHEIGLYVDANISHLFDDCQKRCFDLCCRPNSKYMLAQKLTATSTSLSLDASVGTGVEFGNEYTTIANLTTRNVDVSFGVQVDLSAMLHYSCGNCSWDTGYNFWYRSCEKYDKNFSTIGLDCNTWALKGDAHVIGFEGSSSTPVALAATQQCANINKGLNNFTGPDGTQGGLQGIIPIANPGIDNRVQAATSANTVFASLSLTATTHTSNPPRFLTDCDVDLNSERSKGTSHKIFTHISYTWSDKEDWIPYIGLGAEVEFGTHEDGDKNCQALSDACKKVSFCNDNSCSKKSKKVCALTCEKTLCIPKASCDSSCKKSCNDCPDCSITQWGVWIKGGISFN